jgi:hypothetical protein
MSLGRMHVGVEAVLPTAAIDVSLGGAPELHVTLLAAQASFGMYPAMGPPKNPSKSKRIISKLRRRAWRDHAVENRR